MQSTQVRKHFAPLSAVLLFAAVMLSTKEAHAQSDLPRFEVGAQVAVIDLRDSVGEKPPGVGGRFSYNVNDYAAFDAEVNHFSTGEVNLDRTQGLFGVKAGKRFGGPSVGVFLKARPGFMHFHGARSPGVSVNGTTKFALDLGGVVEFYPSKRTVVRIDVGDTIIFYNGETIRRLSLPGGPQERLGTAHGLQAGIGFGFRF